MLASVIFAFVGRRSPQLPLQTRDLVTERIARLLKLVRPSVVVGAAACGADLLVLEEALALNATGGGPDVHVVLPSSRTTFREESVETDWQAKFDRVLSEMDRRSLRVDTSVAEGASEPYAAGNLAILDRAAEHADARGERVVLLIVATEGEGEYSERMVADAHVRGIRALRIDPAIARANQRRCFVVMPYGRKLDPQRKFEMDCNLTYERFLVPAMEHAQLHYRRADETVDPGVVLRPMIDDIAQSDIVIADLATGNFNVGWELGLRHLLRNRTTILIKPAPNVTAPFDVASLRALTYDHGERGFSDDAILDAWQRLDPLLAADAEPAGPTDSPVVVMMEKVRLAQIEALGTEEREVQDLRDQLADARDLRDADHVEEIAARADTLEPGDARLIRAEAGTILRRLGRHRPARTLLEPIVEADPQVDRPAVHQELAMAYYRAQDAGDAELSKAYAILSRVQRKGGYPETESLLGAIAKRRAALVDEGARAEQLRHARDHYRGEFERDLNAYYAGINVLAVDLVLARVHGDAQAGAELRRLLPAVRLASEVRLERVPNDFWAHATLAEVTLIAELAERSNATGESAAAAYAGLRTLSSMPDELGSVADQLTWYERVGIVHTPLAAARAALGVGPPAAGADPPA
jgi:hypothetical protein